MQKENLMSKYWRFDRAINDSYNRHYDWLGVWTQKPMSGVVAFENTRA